ncbi:hypothetical protein RvY_08199 [Ramazzottius varieornatus]|uniref:STAS domain-containing protein n=1 Tax=Ramazzottius varieornatus TaxID=947166 RepID=A0A1D1V9R3_RAMVA|nr:hypothetical protein RvY_08199 [Ramazzottius varieornatus]
MDAPNSPGHGAKKTPVFVVGDIDNSNAKTPGIHPGLQPDARLQVTRFVYDQPRFDLAYGLCEPGPPLSPWNNVKRMAAKSWARTKGNSRCSPRIGLNCVTRWFPALDWVPKYNWRTSLLMDFAAGVTIGFLNTPQGVAYAILTLCPPVTGLYVSFFPLLVYFLMASSRQCSLGTDAITSLMTSKIVRQYALFPEDTNGVLVHPEYNALVNGSSYTVAELSQVQVATAVAVLVGCWQLAFGLLGAGGLVVYFSDQLVQGFTCGAAFHVFSSQLKSIFGVKGLKDYYGALKLIKTYVNFFTVIGTTHIPTLVTGIISVIILVFIKFYLNTNPKVLAVLKVPIPAELLIVIFGTLISYLIGLDPYYGVRTIKRIPTGMPIPFAPDFSRLDVGAVMGDIFAIAVVTLCISITLGLLFANKNNYALDPNQEFKAQGLAKIFGSFFHCFPSSISIARTAVQNDVGGKTQIVSLVQCLIVLIVIVALGKYLEPLPHPCLGAIVMVSVLKLMMQVLELRKLWTISLVDWSIFLAVFLGVLILDVDLGLAVGIGWGVMTIMLRLQKPKVGQLGRLPGTDIYRRTDVYQTAVEVPGVRIVRVDAPIYFANASYVKARVYAWAGLNTLIRDWKNNPANQGKGEKEMTAGNFAYANNLALDQGQAEAEIEEQRERSKSVVSSMNGQNSYVMHRLSVAPRPRQRRMTIKEDLTRLEMHGVENVAFEDDTEEDVPISHIILDCSEVCFVDVTGVGFLKKTQVECSSVGVELLLACTTKAVRDMLELCGAQEFIKQDQMFVTVHDAVLYAVNKQKRMPAVSILRNGSRT